MWRAEALLALERNILSYRGNDEIDVCSICVEGGYTKWPDEMSQVTLLCGHKFHLKCITEWFKLKKSTCPLCRADFNDLSKYPMEE